MLLMVLGFSLLQNSKRNELNAQVNITLFLNDKFQNQKMLNKTISFTHLPEAPGPSTFLLLFTSFTPKQ